MKNLHDTPAKRQRKAANPEKSVWVAASAGTGKTKVLTDRVLNLLLSGTPPERILCLTFTKAAAAEMSNRIAKNLRNWAVADDENLEKMLVELLGSIDEDRGKLFAKARRLFARILDASGGIRIQTIHSFCQTLLKKFPIEANIAPHFEIMDDRDTVEAMETARDKVFSRINDDILNDAIQDVTGKVHETLFPALIADLSSARGRIKRMLANYGDINGIIAAIYATLELEPSETPDKVIEKACKDSSFNVEELKTACEICLTGKESDIKRGKKLAEWLSSTEKRQALFDDYKSAFLTTKNEIRAKLLTKGLATKYPETENALLIEAERIFRTNNRIKTATVAVSSASLIRLGVALLEEYENYKKSHALMDYSDQILTVRKLLEEKDDTAWVLYKLDGGIDHILVDEAQDTSPDQWAIIKALTEEFFAGQGVSNKNRTVFAVGDRKQSIYSFQGASPAAFEDMRALYEKQVPESGAKWDKIELNTSFRSTKAVLDAVKLVFEQPECRDGVLLPEEDGTHLAFREKDGGLVELWSPIESKSTDEQEPWSPPVERVLGDSPQARMAKVLAERIHKMTSGSEILESKGRPIQPSDIMVLVRRRTSFVDELVRNLKNYKVNVAGVDRMILPEQMAVMDLVAMGNFLLLPEDDLTLASVLKSPLVGLTEEELYELAHNRKSTLWNELKKHIGSMCRFGKAAADLNELLSMADMVRPHELYSHILGKMRGKYKLLSRLGTEAEDPIDEFMTLTLNFERSHIPSLQGFLHWFESGKVEIKRDMEQTEHNSVRIMTVHGSKGLQAPIIFLPDTLQTPPEKARLLWTGKRNDNASLMLWTPSAKDADDFCEAIKEKNKLATEREYRRLLYVAMTRAEDRLYICGWNTKKTAPENCWYNLIKSALEPVADKENDEFLESLEDVSSHEVLRIKCPQAITSKEELKFDKMPDFPLPDWINSPPEDEPVNLKPIAPSKLGEDETATFSPLGKTGSKRYQRGRLIHRMLQSLPDIAIENRRKTAEHFIEKAAQDIEPEQRKEILDETFKVLEHKEFAPLFADGSKAEVCLSGMIGNRVISGQVDRLVTTDDSVLIVDYKTNRPPPKQLEKVPEVYLRQMAVYRTAVSNLYPDKIISCILLWTDAPFIMRLPDEMLDAAIENIRSDAAI